MELTVIGDSVLIEPFQLEETTESGLIIGASAASPWVESTVVAVGEGEDITKSPINVGDDVIFHKDSAIECSIRGEKYYVLGLANVLAIVE